MGRRSGAGRKGRIKTIDIKRQISWRITNAFTHNLNRCINAIAVHPRASQDFKAVITVIISAKPDLR